MAEERGEFECEGYIGNLAHCEFVKVIDEVSKTKIACRRCQRIPRGSVVKCLTHNPGVLGSSSTKSSGFFRGSILGQHTSEPSLVLVKPRKA